MRSRFLDLLAQLPSVKAFVDNITEDIGARRSVVVLVPVTVSPGWVWSLLDAGLWRRQFLVESLDSLALGSCSTPVEALGEALHVKWPAQQSRDVASLMMSEGLPDVVVLEGIETLEPARRDAWLRFVGQWAQIGQNLAGRSSPAPVLCAILQPACFAFDALESNVLLGIHWWWGLPSVLELKLLCRLASRTDTGNGSDARWLEYLLPALATNDIVLLERLWDAHVVQIDQFMACIRELGHEREWTGDCLRQWGAAQLMSSSVGRNGPLPPVPPVNVRVLWSRGAVHATHEYGVELHPSALHMLGRQSELQHRLWRGQAELLQPALDSIRLDFCSYLTRSYGREWPVRWLQPEHPDEEAAVRENPLACQWGYLEWLIRNCPQLSRERRWLSLITPAARARNAVAHYRVVSRGDYEHIMLQHRQFAEATACPRL